jgi:hypothetical protein
VPGARASTKPSASASAAIRRKRSGASQCRPTCRSAPRIGPSWPWSATTRPSMPGGSPRSRRATRNSSTCSSRAAIRCSGTSACRAACSAACPA